MLLLLAALLQSSAPPTMTCPAGEQCGPGMIFFDSGKSDIRKEWNPVVDAAAAAGRSGRRLTITAFSDRSGSAAGNLRLSRARAETVRAALVAAGVPADHIAVAAVGEDRLLIPTADGVREIQNRRVEIEARP